MFVENVDVPLLLIGPVPSKVTPSRKVTVPLVTPLGAITVKVTLVL